MRVFSFIVCLLFCAACSPDESPNPLTPRGAADDVILPLQLGNSWILKITEVDSNHVFVFASSDTLAVTRETVIGGWTWYMDQAGDTMQNRTDGLWKMAGGVPSLYLKYPGNVYDSTTALEAGQRVSIKIFATNQLVVIPQGQFTCVAYRTTRLADGRILHDDFYAPAFGPIIGQRYDITPTGRSYQRYYIQLASWQVQ